MMRRLLTLVLVSAGLVSVASAQRAGEGSVYSRFGLGEMSPRYSSKSHALGGGGLAYSASSFVNLANPASLSDQVLTRLSGGLRFEGIETTDALDVQSKLSSSTFDGLSVGLPLLSGKLGLGLGFSKMTRVGYQINVVNRLDLGPDVDSGEQYAASYQGTGGLNVISLGGGYRFNRNLSVGLRGDVVFGLIEDAQETLFFDSRFTDTRLVRSTRLRGASAGVGVRATLRGLLRDGDFLNIGAAFDLPTHLSGERVLAEGEDETPDTLGVPISGTADLPFSMAVGLLYQPSATLSVNADVRYEPWSEFESSFAFPGYVPGVSSNFSDRRHLSAGIEYFPAGRDLFASYLQQTAYRLGFFHESGYVSPDAAERVNTFGITSGLSLPTLSAGTRIDINLDVGTRGTAAGSLVRDRFIRIGLHFNFAERWFARRQLG